MPTLEQFNGLCDILEIETDKRKDLSYQELSQAFKQKSLKMHPDRFPADRFPEEEREQATAKFQELSRLRTEFPNEVDFNRFADEVLQGVVFENVAKNYPTEIHEGDIYYVAGRRVNIREAAGGITSLLRGNPYASMRGSIPTEEIRQACPEGATSFKVFADLDSARKHLTASIGFSANPDIEGTSIFMVRVSEDVEVNWKQEEKRVSPWEGKSVIVFASNVPLNNPQFIRGFVAGFEDTPLDFDAPSPQLAIMGTDQEPTEALLPELQDILRGYFKEKQREIAAGKTGGFFGSEGILGSGIGKPAFSNQAKAGAATAFRNIAVTGAGELTPQEISALKDGDLGKLLQKYAKSRGYGTVDKLIETTTRTAKSRAEEHGKDEGAAPDEPERRSPRGGGASST